MRSASFHFAIRSERANEPTLSCPAPQPIARCTIDVSSVSPERAETIVPKPARRPSSRAALASLTVPAWLTLIKTALTLSPPRRVAHPARAGDEIIVADHLDAVADRGGEALEPLVVILGERVLDRQDRIAVEPTKQHLGQRVAVELALIEAKTIAAALTEFRRGDVERQADILARNEAGAFDRAHQRVERLLVGRERRPPAAFVGHALEEAAVGHDRARGAIDFGRHFQRLGEAFGARRDDHEILDVGSPSRMRAAAKDLDLRQRNDRLSLAQEMAPERQAAACGRGMKDAERNGGQRVSAEPRLVRRPVEGDELGVDRGLVERVEADQRGRDFSCDPGKRILHVETAEALASIALVDRLAAPARGAGRRNAPPRRAVAERDFRFDGRAAARIPDAPRDQRLDDRLAHRDFSLALRRPEGASKGLSRA